MKEAAQLANQNEQERTFDRLDTEVKRLTTLTVEDGTKIPFTGNMKIVYSYLYTFYTNEKRLNYPDPIYPNMRLIAEENGITLPTAQKCINSLVNAGVLIKDSIQVKAGFESNNYIVMLPAEVVARNKTPGAQPKPTKQKPDLRIVQTEEKPDEKRADESSACVAPVQAVPDIVQATDQSAVDLRADPVPECASSVVDVPLTEAPEGFDEVKAPCAEIAPITVLEDYLKTNGIGLTPEGNNYVLQWLPECSSNLERRIFVSKQIDKQKQGGY